MLPKLFQFFLLQEAGAYIKYILNIYREYLLCWQSNAGATFLQT